LDRSFAEVGKSPVGVEGVELFLGYDCVKSGEHEGDGLVIANVVSVVALDLVGDVVDELGEEGDLDEFVEGDKLETCLGIFGDTCWGCAVGKAAMCGCFDLGEDSGGVGNYREAI
jgi:hypothetical protein